MDYTGSANADVEKEVPEHDALEMEGVLET